MLLLLLSACYITTVKTLALCPMPHPVPQIPAPWVNAGSLTFSNDGTEDVIECITSTVIAQFDSTSNPFIILENFKCDAVKRTWALATQYEAPAFLSCATYPFEAPIIPTCEIVHRSVLGGQASVYVMRGMEQICPAGQTLKLQNEQKAIKTIKCSSEGQLDIILENGSVPAIQQPAETTCVPVPTTTSTTTTTTTTTVPTTVRKDANPTAAHLWNVMFYYNYGVGVHAYCADSTCITAIQKNGIGYDMVNGKGLLGRAVSEAAIGAVKTACPTGSQNLRNLGFTKSGNKYLHNLAGTGLKQGWVSISSGACGAKSPIKRWKSRYTDDMMYGTNLEWNTWYQGMVQDGGKVLFYMWE